MTDRRALFHNGLLRILGVAVAAALIGLAVPMVGQPLGMTIPFGIQLPGIEASVDLTSLPFPQASAYVGSGILFGILGAILLAVALLPARRGPAMLLLKPASDKSFGGGSVRISERSVRHISSRAAELVPGVREAVTRVRMRNDGWQVHCRASITPESSLSDTSTAVRTAISQAIQQQTGLPASRIDVESHQATLQAARQLH